MKKPTHRAMTTKLITSRCIRLLWYEMLEEESVMKEDYDESHEGT